MKQTRRVKASNRGPKAVVGGLLAMLIGVVALSSSPVAHGAPSGKITICHRTHSTTNPYRRISVSQNGVQHGGHGGHDRPAGYTSNPAVFDPNFGYAPSAKYWEDIIPGGDSEGLAYNGTNPIAMNWTTLGKAAFTTYCAKMSPSFFYQSEVDGGRTPQQAIDDLNEQQANEDIALLNALPGGTFTLANISSWDTAVSVTTIAADGVLTTSATLHGSLTVGATSTVPSFEWSSSSTLATYSSAAAAPTPVTNTTAVSANLTGLTPGATYYFRVVGTTNAGTDTEGILLGAIMSFTTPTVAESTTTTTATTVPASTTSTTTTVPASTTTTATTVPASTTSTTTTVPASTTTTATTVPESTTSTTVPASTTTTTTVPESTTTTVPATTVPAGTTTTDSTSVNAKGSIRGVVWFDRNGNGIFDANEWVLPGVTVTLSQPTPPATESFNGPGSVLRNAKANVQLTATSGADGSYQFLDLTPGSYQVRAAASIKGFDYTSDTDGGADWVVGVSVPADRVEVADFAGLGRGEVMGRMFETTTSAGLPFATIHCTWSGFDDLAGTSDDLVLTFSADGNGAFDVNGVPYGFFDCSGIEANTGRTSSVASLSVFSPQPAVAALPVTGLATPTGTLPTTGSNDRDTLRLALLLLTVGAVSMRVARRRKLI